MSAPEVCTEDLPGRTEIEAAAQRLAGQAVRTPLLEDRLLNDRLSGRLLVKAEPLQRTGSFKFRGAYNAIASLQEADRARGVVAFSSGNHAQAVAAAARLFGIDATIVMPADAPAVKIARTRAHGARVVTYDRVAEDREAIANTIQRDSGASLIRPYDDPAVIAGQGTIGLEMVDQMGEAGLSAPPDTLVICCSGGGLSSGIALAVETAWPDTAIVVVEPAGYDAMGRSIVAGEPVRLTPPGPTLCDALTVPFAGGRPWQVARRRFTRGVAITDDQALDAVSEAARSFKLVVEPGGAAAIAAVLAGLIPIEGRTVIAVASGGNVDPAIHAQAMMRPVAEP
jgi:threonine dehydratase